MRKLEMEKEEEFVSHLKTFSHEIHESSLKVLELFK